MSAFSQLIITPSSNAQALVEKLVGGGVSISNVTITGSSLSTGFFRNAGNTLLALDSGIVLSTGRVLTSGPFGLNGTQSSLASSAVNTPGNPQLSQISNQLTKDAVVLEFDFVPLGDVVKFQYIFSSEEYPDYNCSIYNDVFAFFISGPGITGSRNIALVPNTTIPVSINSINNGQPGTQASIGTCNAMGPGAPFTQYYVNNSGSANFTHNGHTRVLTATAPVQPCLVYHLKIAIADGFDDKFDSGVFLAAQSLTSDPLTLDGSTPTVGGKPYLAEGCHTGGITIRRPRVQAQSQTVNLAFTGSAVNGTDVQALPTSVTIPANETSVFIPIVPVLDNVEEGIETMKIYLSNICASSNFYFDSIELQIRDYDTLTILPRGPLSLCGPSPVQLTVNDVYNTYQWSPAAGLNTTTGNTVTAAPAVSTNYVCLATRGDCKAMDSVTIAMKTIRLLSKKDILCQNGRSGEIHASGGWAFTQPVEYSINTRPYGIDSSFTGLVPGDYTVRIRDASGCVDSMTLTLVQLYPQLSFTESITTASCTGSNGRVELLPSGGLQPYTYSLGGTSYGTDPELVAGEGNHTVFVKDVNGCVASKPVTVGKDGPIQFSLTPAQGLCNGSVQDWIYFTASGGSGQYTYSLDGTNFSDADSLLVTTSSFTATVTDDKGCTSSKPVAVPLGEVVFVNAGNDTSICEGTAIRFATTANADAFSWRADPSLSATNIATPLASPGQPTVYYISATKDICTVHDTITVHVRPAPVANAGKDSSICLGRTIQLTGSGGAAYSWTPASLVDDPASNAPQIRPQLSASYYLHVTDATGCTSVKADTVRITVVPSIRAFAGRDTSVAIGQPFQLNGRDLGNNMDASFLWSPATGLSDPAIANPLTSLDRDMTYLLTVTTPEGCTGTDEIFVRAFKEPDIYVPTGFTPNGDGLNDLLRAIPVGMKSFGIFRVYNRWGQPIFSTTTEQNGWDGRINGVVQQTGTYVWIAEAIDFNGKKVSRRGVVTLLR